MYVLTSQKSMHTFHYNRSSHFKELYFADDGQRTAASRACEMCGSGRHSSWQDKAYLRTRMQ